MLFNSIDFIIFYLIVVSLFFILPHRYRWILLLSASYIFYMAWKPAYILLIIFSTLVDYFCSLKMGSLNTKKEKKKYLLLSLFVNLGMLFLFKYFNFFSYTLDMLFNFVHIEYSPIYTSLLLPMGISFYTFQTLSYSIDVYRGKQEPEKHLGIFALYVSFFPQLVAGPIERSTRLIPQFYEVKKFDYYRAKEGLFLILLGYFKKIVIADRISVIVGTVFNDPYQFNSLQLLVATLLFAVQIYCDFSGYSSIAIGVAKIMGYDLMENFKTPYFAKTVKEFWRRWHISLSTWLSDYIYIPLGGSRVSKVRKYFNTFTTFFISGLWHGASWHFIIWGCIHGLYLIIGEITLPIRSRISSILYLDKLHVISIISKTLVTFVLVSFAWIFFVASSVSDAVYTSLSIISIDHYSILDIRSLLSLGLDIYDVGVAFISIVILFIYELIINIYKELRLYRTKWITYIIIILFVLGFRYANTNAFIYFQF